MRRFLIFMTLAWCLGAAAPWLRAQPALRASLAGALAAEARREALEGEDAYNLKGGALRLLLRSTLGIEYNDNISYGRQEHLSDLILIPGIGANVSWRVSAANTLRVGLDLGYRFHTTHSEYNRPQTSQAGTELAFDIYAGDFVITPYDRFRYRYDLGEYGAAVGQANYGGLDNTLGVNALWDINDVVVTVGYGWNLFTSDSSRYSYQDRNGHFVLGRVALLPLRPLVFGLETTVGLNEYVEPILNNSRQLSAGAFAEWPLTRFVTLTARGGGVFFTFDQTGVLQSPGTMADPYFQITMAHQINRHLSHSLGGGQSLNLGFYGDLQSVYDLRYSVRFTGIRNVPLSFGISYENREEPTVELPQRWNRMGFTVGTGYRIGRDLSSSLSYSHTLYEGRRASGGYSQNVIRLGLAYRF